MEEIHDTPNRSRLLIDPCFSLQLQDASSIGHVQAVLCHQLAKTGDVEDSDGEPVCRPQQLVLEEMLHQVGPWHIANAAVALFLT